MKDGSGWTPKDRKTETEVKRCYKKIHEGGTSKDRRSTRPENVEIENSMRRPQIGKSRIRIRVQGLHGRVVCQAVIGRGGTFASL